MAAATTDDGFESVVAQLKVPDEHTQAGRLHAERNNNNDAHSKLLVGAIDATNGNNNESKQNEDEEEQTDFDTIKRSPARIMGLKGSSTSTATMGANGSRSDEQTQAETRSLNDVEQPKTALQTVRAMSIATGGRSRGREADEASSSASSSLCDDSADDSDGSHPSSLESCGRGGRDSAGDGAILLPATPKRRRNESDGRARSRSTPRRDAAADELGSSTSASIDSFEIADLTLSASEYLRDSTDDLDNNDAANDPVGALPALDEEADESAASSAESTLLQTTTTDDTISSSDTAAENAPCTSMLVTTQRPLATLSEQTKRSIHAELSQLDTALPELDFVRLEQKLTDAAREVEMKQRRLMSEEVRRRLATGDDQDEYDESGGLHRRSQAECSQRHPPAPTTRPLRSNLASRLRSGMHMQVCYLNDAAAMEDSRDDDDEEDELEAAEAARASGSSFVPKSVSTPAIAGNQPTTQQHRGSLIRSGSTSYDCTKSASELRRAKAQAEPVDSDRLESEARLMLLKAKEAAAMQMELEKQQMAGALKSPIEEIVGVTLSKKLTRQQLTKMGLTQLQLIVNDLHTKIELLNEQLVHLLIERDGLHMEQDSMLVDVEDMLQHQRHSEIVLPEFLVHAPIASGSNSKRLRIFKR